MEPVQPYSYPNMSEAEWNELKSKTLGDAHVYVVSDNNGVVSFYNGGTPALELLSDDSVRASPGR